MTVVPFRDCSLCPNFKRSLLFYAVLHFQLPAGFTTARFVCIVHVTRIISLLNRFRARAVSTMFNVLCYYLFTCCESRGIMYMYIYKYLHSHGHEDATLQSTINIQEHSTAKTSPCISISASNRTLSARRRELLAFNETLMLHRTDHDAL